MAKRFIESRLREENRYWNRELLHAKKIRYAAQSHPCDNESVNIRNEVGIRHQGDATRKRYKLVLLLAVDEKAETNGTEQKSPEKNS